MAKRPAILRCSLSLETDVIIPPGSRVELEEAEFNRLLSHGLIDDPSAPTIDPGPGVSAISDPAS